MKDEKFMLAKMEKPLDYILNERKTNLWEIIWAVNGGEGEFKRFP